MSNEFRRRDETSSFELWYEAPYPNVLRNQGRSMGYVKGFILKFKEEWEEKGRESGFKQNPPVNAKSDENEDLLITTAKEKIFELETRHQDEIVTKKDELNRFKSELAKKNFNGAKESLDVERSISLTSLDLDNCFQKHFVKIRDEQSTLNRLRGQLKRFKYKNDLDRDASYPASHKYYIAVMVIIVLVEAIINAYAHQGEDGLIAGGGLALIISASNVFLAWGLGFWFRYINYKIVPWRKYSAWAALPLMIIVAVYANSLYSTFRSEFATLLLDVDIDTAKAAKDAFGIAIKKAHTVFYGGIPFNDLTSFITFVITVIFSFIAFVEGYRWDDPCPEYGKLTRDFLGQKEKLESLVSALELEVELKTDTASEEFSANSRKINTLSPSHLLETADRMEADMSAINAYVDLLNSELSNVICAYRDANKKARGDELAPEIFSRDPQSISLSFIANHYPAVIKDYRIVAKTIEEEYESTVMYLRKLNDEFKHRCYELKINKTKQFRNQIESEASIAASQMAKGYEAA